jgi:hypothetical protein
VKPFYCDFRRARLSRFGATIFVALVFFGVGCSSEDPAETTKLVPVAELTVEPTVEESPRIGEFEEMLEPESPRLGTVRPIRLGLTSRVKWRIEGVGLLHGSCPEPPGARGSPRDVHGVHILLIPAPLLEVREDRDMWRW